MNEFKPNSKEPNEKVRTRQVRKMMRKLDEIFERDPVPSLCEALLEVGCPCSKCGSKRIAENEKGIFCKDCKNYLALKCGGELKIKLGTALGLMRK